MEELVSRGAESDPNGTSFVPALAAGADFGKHLGTTGKYGPDKPAVPAKPPAPTPALPGAPRKPFDP